MKQRGTILISATNKTGLQKFAQAHKVGWKIISTGGTTEKLRKLGIMCTSVEKITSFPEMMDGRLKTLHPMIHGGILADRSNRAHLESATDHDIPLIDVVVVNLYRFEDKPSVENIDVGGHALIRAAAKNAASVAVVVDPDDYDELITQITGSRPTNATEEFREYLAHKAFDYIAAYDAAITKWMAYERTRSKPFLK